MWFSWISIRFQRQQLVLFRCVVAENVVVVVVVESDNSEDMVVISQVQQGYGSAGYQSGLRGDN